MDKSDGNCLLRTLYLFWAQLFALTAPLWAARPLRMALLRSVALLGRALIRVRLCLVHIRVLEAAPRQ
jgi:hypothetical protein